MKVDMSTTDFSHRKDDLLSEVRDGILILTINRQQNYNSWTSALRDEMARQLLAANANDAIRGAIITGAGDKAFCSGQHLPELEEFEDGRKIADWLSRLTYCYDAVRGFTKPLVAAVNGVAAGSGFQVTQFCDWVVTHPDVKLGQTEVNSGLPSVFGTWLMWERIGRRAIQMSLKGMLVTAHEARDLGFVHEVVEREQVMQTAIAVVNELARQPRMAYLLSKEANRMFDEERYKNAMNMALGYYKRAFDSGAPQAEIARFFEKRAQRKAA
jgi:enoyl-CoA hydratase/carnithine racemase